jgi:hypothetical protein
MKVVESLAMGMDRRAQTTCRSVVLFCGLVSVSCGGLVETIPESSGGQDGSASSTVTLAPPTASASAAGSTASGGSASSGAASSSGSAAGTPAGGNPPSSGFVVLGPGPNCGSQHLQNLDFFNACSPDATGKGLYGPFLANGLCVFAWKCDGPSPPGLGQEVPSPPWATCTHGAMCAPGWRCDSAAAPEGCTGSCLCDASGHLQCETVCPPPAASHLCAPDVTCSIGGSCNSAALGESGPCSLLECKCEPFCDAGPADECQVGTFRCTKTCGVSTPTDAGVLGDSGS